MSPAAGRQLHSLTTRARTQEEEEEAKAKAKKSKASNKAKAEAEAAKDEEEEDVDAEGKEEVCVYPPRFRQSRTVSPTASLLLPPRTPLLHC